MFRFRKASIRDARLFFNWANDPDVRSNSVNINSILWSNHLIWFESKLSSITSHLFVMELDSVPIGQVRFDKDNTNNYWIDFSIDKDNRGKGLGVVLIENGISELKKFDTNLNLYALVKENNIASSNTFKKMNFQIIDAKLIDNFKYYVFKLNQ
jgi:RimJ/RimL family protein N-acetyltransferase